MLCKNYLDFAKIIRNTRIELSDFSDDDDGDDNVPLGDAETKEETDKIRCWHFIAEDRRLRWGTREVVEAGKTYTCEFPYEYKGSVYPKPTLCNAGLHGSRKILDALNYAASSWCCEVK
ncbi:MAG: hypothetical protein ACOC80_09805, partial [Petrotogales bacterium]